MREQVLQYRCVEQANHIAVARAQHPRWSFCSVYRRHLKLLPRLGWRDHWDTQYHHSGTTLSLWSHCLHCRF